MNANDNNQITSGQAVVNTVKARQGENTRITRELMVPQAGVTGGTGDSDQRRMMTQALSNQILIQRGMNGWQAGALALNMQPNTYKEGLPFVLHNSAPFMWGHTMLGAGDYPFLKTMAWAPACGSSSSPSHMELYCPAPGSNWNVPPIWPGVRHDSCASGGWGSGTGGSGVSGGGTPVAYTTGDPAPSAAPTSVTASKSDASTIQITWVTGETFAASYPYTHADTTTNIVVPSGYEYIVKVAGALTGPFSPVGDVPLSLYGYVTSNTFYPQAQGTINPSFPSAVSMYYNYLFSAIPGNTYFFTVTSTNPSGAGPASSVVSVTM